MCFKLPKCKTLRILYYDIILTWKWNKYLSTKSLMGTGISDDSFSCTTDQTKPDG